VAILGGAKVSDKIGVIENLIDKVDTLIIGGGMAYTFFFAQGHTIGNSLVEADKVEIAKALLEKAAAKGINMLLPVDNVIGTHFAADCESKSILQMKSRRLMGLDIGPETVKNFTGAVKDAGTVVWNGPMGVFEFDRFANGTREVAKAISESNAISIIGGGDSAAAVELLCFADKVSHISTGGGASLEYTEGKVCPASTAYGQEPPPHLCCRQLEDDKGVPADAVKKINELKPLVAHAGSQIALGSRSPLCRPLSKPPPTAMSKWPPRTAISKTLALSPVNLGPHAG
jgi:triosephosphate isomerase